MQKIDNNIQWIIQFNEYFTEFDYQTLKICQHYGWTVEYTENLDFIERKKILHFIECEEKIKLYISR